MDKIEQKIPEITSDTTWSWDCPVCDESNEIEFNGDGFHTPLECGACGEKFDDYRL